MYGYVYLTHCSKTNKYYIGVHRWNVNYNGEYDNHIFNDDGSQKFKIDPNYLGSGVLLNKAIKKYGRKYFYILEILDIANTKEELYELEKYWIALFRSQNKELYNISDGGLGGWQNDKAGSKNPMFGKKHSEEAKRKMSECHKGCVPWNKGKKMSQDQKEKLSLIRKQWIGDKNPQYGRKRSEETKRKMSESKLKLIANGWKTPNNSGKIAISKNNQRKFIKQDDLDLYLEKGWNVGWKIGC